jgi:hypothetical protein
VGGPFFCEHRHCYCDDHPVRPYVHYCCGLSLLPRGHHLPVVRPRPESVRMPPPMPHVGQPEHRFIWSRYCDGTPAALKARRGPQ